MSYRATNTMNNARQSNLQPSQSEQQENTSFSQSNNRNGPFQPINSTSNPEKSWPQSEFVTSVIEAPIDQSQPGWRNRDVASAKEIRVRAENGMDASVRAGLDKSVMGGGAAVHHNPTSRLGKNVVPSHLTHMKYKGYDPTDPDSRAYPSVPLPKDEISSAFDGTASFGTKTRRKTDQASQAEEEERRRQMEQQASNFPPIFPTALFNSYGEEESEARRAALEEEARLRYNIPLPRATSPIANRKTSYRSNSLNRRGSFPSVAEQDQSSGRTTGANFGQSASRTNLQTEKISQSGTTSFAATDGTVRFCAVKVSHQNIVNNNNTFDKILAHMLNYGIVVNPFNHVSRNRLRACFPPGTPMDMLSNADSRRGDHKPDPQLLKQANETITGLDWIKFTYETSLQAHNALKSHNIIFEGYPLQITLWGSGDEYDLQAGASQDLKKPSEQRTNKPLENVNGNPLGAGQMLRVQQENIFLRQPGLWESWRAGIYSMLVPVNTARYDEDGNYIRGSGGWLLDLWHLFVN